MSGNDNSFIVRLPDGRRLELCSTEGADAFLRLQSSESFDWLTVNFTECKRIRNKKRRINAAMRGRLQMVGCFVESFARYATHEVFAEAVPHEEIVFWLDYVMDEFKKLINDPGWLRNGTLSKHDTYTIQPCISMFMHKAPARLALER